MNIEAKMSLALLAVSLISAIRCSGTTPAAPTPLGNGRSSATSVNQPAAPFTGTVVGEASFDFTNPRSCAAGFTTITDATGTSTHLGLTTWHSEHCVFPDGSIPNGSLVLTGANGDKVYASYSGTTTAPGEIGSAIDFRGTIVVTGGTGRFAQATGKAEVTGTITFEGFADPSWPGRWTWNGSMAY